MTTHKVYSTHFDSELDSVISIWKGYSTSIQFREGTEEMLGIIESNRTQKVLVDLKEMVLIGKDDQEWMDRSFLPSAIEKGMKIVAVVQPDYYFNKVAVESIVYKINQQLLTVNFFKTIEDARVWLKNEK
ncbi:STAS/SEC14 domain-containing protein [Xanthocytophaga flava]|uniref:STAS/SEC14 domain-containing protein n=1 Tax=Xanthocytophaga flava TaxID=3048013 RepID=UPI0028D65B67|nr:STAS/SEC14 domain-containing protein [Xanthocytophaga flavus]MDJ1467267.1 STAS/SEC14 domain-containing protein [Xanthocytophaga flavus]